jgi:hypothetical protein
MHTPGRFAHVKEPRYPPKRRLVGSQSRSKRFGEEKNPFRLPGFELRTVRSVAQSLYRLSYPGSKIYLPCLKVRNLVYG